MQPSAAAGVRGQLVGLVTDGFVLCFALWTVACHAAVLAGGTVRWLAFAALAVVVALGCLAWHAWRRPALRASYLDDLANDVVPSELALGARWRWLAFGAVALGVATWLSTHAAWAVWSEAALFSLAMLAIAWTRPTAADASAQRASPLEARELRVLFALALACALLSLSVSRPRSDETFYVHLAVSMNEYPELPLLSVNTLHGPASETLPPQAMFPPYRVHAYEALVGLLSRLTGIEAARLSHIGFVALFALLVPFALTRLLRLLVPRRWLVALFVLLAFYCIEGSASRGYANQAFVRLFSGKSAMLTLVVPLLYAYGLRFGQGPSRWRFLWLALSQIVAVGLSSTALWLAPVLAGIGALSGIPSLRRCLVTLPLAGASSLYVLALALWVRAQFGRVNVSRVEHVSMPDAGVPTTPVDVAGFGLHEWAFPITLGPATTALGLLAAVGCTFALVRGVGGLRLFAASGALYVLGLGNPWLAAFFAENVTGPVTYERSLWMLPVPLAVALSAVGLLDLLERRLAPRLARVALAALVASFHLLVTDRLVLSAENRATFVFPPVTKLAGHSRNAARSVCRWAPRGDTVLAAEGISQQLPTLHGCGFPVLAAERWIATSPGDLEDRERLVRYVSGDLDVPRERAHWFLDALERYGVDVVVLGGSAMRQPRLKALLFLGGFEKVDEVEWEFVWARVSIETLEENRRAADVACRFASRDVFVLAPFGVSGEIEKRGCARPVLRVPSPGTVMSLAQDALLSVERAVHVDVKPKLSERELAQLKHWLARPELGVVVVTRQALGNRELKTALREHGFQRAVVLAGHQLYRRPP